jgi:cysteinyl-tRNA synthetase
MLQTHYSSEIDFSNKALQDAEKAYRKINNALSNLQELEYLADHISGEKEDEIKALCASCTDHMNDDFNTAKTIASLFGIAAHINTYYDKGRKVTDISSDAFDILKDTYSSMVVDVLGLKPETIQNNDVLDDVMEILINIRNAARANKDWATSDLVRDQLGEAKIILKDNKDGTTTYEVG